MLTQLIRAVHQLVQQPLSFCSVWTVSCGRQYPGSDRYDGRTDGDDFGEVVIESGNGGAAVGRVAVADLGKEMLDGVDESRGLGREIWLKRRFISLPSSFSQIRMHHSP